MSRQNINPDIKFANSDGFMLTDIETDESLMLIPCDSAGNFSWAGASRAPLQRNALQTSSTNNQYSDIDAPWLSIAQDDWTGGRGNDLYNKDATRYADGKRCQAAFNNCIFNGPLEYYSGMRKALTNCPGPVHWEMLKDRKYIAAAITPDAALTAGEIYLHLRRRGTPEKSLYVRLQDGLSANAQILASKTYSTTIITDTLSEFIKWTFPEDEDVIMAANHTYYLVVFTTAGDEENHWEVGVKQNSESRTTFVSERRSDDYEPVTYDLYYRIAERQDGYQYRFFAYEQLIFCAKWYKNNNETTSLWMNGDIGKATGSTTMTITDSTKAWTENCWAGARIGLVYYAGSEGRISVWRTIVSNTADTITIDRMWDITPSTNCSFIINDTPIWTELTGHGLTRPIHDILVARGRVLFAQGCWVDTVQMRWNIANTAWEYKTLEGAKADYFALVRDSSGLMLWRGRNYGNGNYRRVVDRSVWLDWGSPREMCNISEAVSNKPVPGSSDPNPRAIVYTDYVDCGSTDYDKEQYVIDISDFESKNKSGQIVITLQESRDHKNWRNVQSVTADNIGRYYIYAHCQYRFRRLKLAVSGTECEVNNIVCSTSQDPVWEDPFVLVDNYGKITRLMEYGSDYNKSLWIFQEGMISSVNKVDSQTDTYTLDRINIDELSTTAEEWNGAAAATSNVYMYFSWLNGLQRYYSSQLEGKGPDRDQGLPFDRQGRVSQIIAYPSNLFASIDAGRSGYSSVMFFNGSGWHEIYRAPNKGERIRDMIFQPIYGDRPDRLWISVGDDVVWLAMPSKVLYALHDPNAEYTHESVLVSSWHTAGMIDVEKLWDSLKIMADNLSESCWIEADYQLDKEEQWHPIEDWYGISPSQKEILSEEKSVNGKKFRYRLRLQTADIHQTPKVNAVVIEAVGRVDVKMSFGFHFRAIKYKRDLTGEYEDLEPIEALDTLDSWANGLRKLRLNSRWKAFDDKIVYLDSSQISLLHELNEGYIGTITLNEL